ncbi:hypothetical protein B0H11DRAFT_2237726 [Mycena galericulata]|nr:hypothetical protein B0H11DRAFT_2237726 [Mycena galericulata]
MKFSVTLLALSLTVIGVQAHELPSRYASQRRGNQFVTGPCTQDSDCQQGCCAFTTGKCAGPGVAQTNADGGCGFGNKSPNCNVAAALKLSACVAGAVNGDLSDPAVQMAAAFTAKLDGLKFTPSKAAAAAAPAATKSCHTSAAAPAASISTASQSSKLFVTAACTADSQCQQGCCAFSTGKCAGPDVAQSNGDGGCGFGDKSPNCNVVTALGFTDCVAGFVNGDIQDPAIQAAAAFTAKLDGLKLPPSSQ